MNKIIYIKRSEKERNQASKIFAIVMIIAIFAVLGILYLIETVEKLTTCGGPSSCLIKSLGECFAIIIGIYLLGCILYWIFYMLNGWKEIDPKDEKHKKKIKK